MNTETFEAKLIHFDEPEYRRKIADFEKNKEILNQIVELYGTLFAGKITRERLEEIFAGNYRDLREAALLAVAKSAKNQMLAEIALQRTEERLIEFEFTASRLVDRFNKSSERQIFATVTPLKWYSLNSDGRFDIPAETFAQIKESCSNYISSPEEQEILDRFKKLADMMNDVYDSLGENLRDQLGGNFLPRHYNLCEFFIADDEGITIPDPQNNYKILSK